MNPSKYRGGAFDEPADPGAYPAFLPAGDVTAWHDANAVVPGIRGWYDLRTKRERVPARHGPNEFAASDPKFREQGARAFWTGDFWDWPSRDGGHRHCGPWDDLEWRGAVRPPWHARGFSVGLWEGVLSTLARYPDSAALFVTVYLGSEWGTPHSPLLTEVEGALRELRRGGALERTVGGWRIK